ncbi:MAG: hypothetical protein TR69_WS6001001159 [candidate division WS6 bacterium OLB20]|uniref:Uncharacterized protein n=1 Tax=candidate division WS6 bacterium OLB20 TaxID=1617426 RepID=A0A136LWY4_9BACT|nr:MAG: hypothetical protein TR69_WS6001001159 [candidate division WS6 bacterium OLB20]
MHPARKPGLLDLYRVQMKVAESAGPHSPLISQNGAFSVNLVPDEIPAATNDIGHHVASVMYRNGIAFEKSTPDNVLREQSLVPERRSAISDQLRRLAGQALKQHYPWQQYARPLTGLSDTSAPLLTRFKDREATFVGNIATIGTITDNVPDNYIVIGPAEAGAWRHSRYEGVYTDHLVSVLYTTDMIVKELQRV